MADKELVRMANDIAKFWTSYPEDEARDMWSEHINKFWEPSMRAKLIELIKDGPEQFADLAVSCVDRIKCSKYNPINVEFKEKTGSGG